MDDSQKATAALAEFGNKPRSARVPAEWMDALRVQFEAGITLHEAAKAAGIRVEALAIELNDSGKPMMLSRTFVYEVMPLWMEWISERARLNGARL